MDRATARIELNGDFTAEQLEEIIRDFAEVRASLRPSVPMQPPSEMSGANVLLQDETQFAFRRLVTGGLRIWLRNEGIGWVAFSLSATDVLGIREFLGQEVAGPANAH